MIKLVGCKSTGLNTNQTIPVRKPMSDISNQLLNPPVSGIQDSINTPKRKRTPAVDRVSSIREVSLSDLVKETDHHDY